MRYDKPRRVVELESLVAGKVVDVGYNELTIEKNGKKYRVEFDYESGWYLDDISIACVITEVKDK